VRCSKSGFGHGDHDLGVGPCETARLFEPLHDSVDDVEHHQVFLVRDGEVLVHTTDPTAATPVGVAAAREITGQDPALVLGRTLDTLYWASELPASAEVPADHRVEGLRSLYGHLSDLEWNIAGRATQLLDWHRDNQHCGRCGASMRRAAGERAMRCDVDGFTAYPRLSPAVIVLVERDDGRALLGRSGRWDMPMYSTLAGFVEAGETLEDTVHREIREEVGVEVDDVRYFASQPWPFPNSLMLGFVATWTGGEITVDGDEIADAQWFSADDLPMIPGKLSIARALIDDWIARVS
jgi:NAD+ diphosphatase